MSTLIESSKDAANRASALCLMAFLKLANGIFEGLFDSGTLFITRCVTSKVNEAVKIKRVSVIDDIEQDTHGMGQDFGMPEIQ